MQIPPWVALTVSCLALAGVVFSALIQYRSHREAKEAENLRARYRREHEQKLEEIRAAIQREAGHHQILITLNQENWRNVHAGIRTLRDRGFKMSAEFKALANHAHSNVGLSEEQLVAESLNALRSHDEFRKALKALRGEIRPKDYDDLHGFLEYLVLVFLDVGRTIQERQAKIQTMKMHEAAIVAKEKWFQKIIQNFLQPYTKAKPE